jgi:nucleoside-diphosphate-sugar epimerase
VTGATAGIGLAIAQALVDEGATVTITGRKQAKLDIALNALQSGKRGIAKGLNRWSDVYIDDMIDLYLLALEKAPSGSFFFAENGEESLKRIAESISNSLGFGGKTESWPAEDAIAEHGDWARFALASNSRVRATNARSLLGWSPNGPSILKAIEEGEIL